MKRLKILVNASLYQCQMIIVYVRDKSLGSTYMSTHTSVNCIRRFWLGSVCSASKLNSKCTQMNYEMNCITMHRCTEMYYNVLQCTPNGPSKLASASPRLPDFFSQLSNSIASMRNVRYLEHDQVAYFHLAACMD